GARLSSRENMIAALRRLQSFYDRPAPEDGDALAAFKISSHKRSGFIALFSTHPALEDRIAALERGR
ncbi:MAG: protease HtpX, partial [Bdellovibrionaceae bacterium]|nr:protease HtpX [Pseudobdellovibrionaceae bacterium]